MTSNRWRPYFSGMTSGGMTINRWIETSDFLYRRPQHERVQRRYQWSFTREARSQMMVSYLFRVLLKYLILRSSLRNHLASPIPWWLIFFLSQHMDFSCGRNFHHGALKYWYVDMKQRGWEAFFTLRSGFRFPCNSLPLGFLFLSRALLSSNFSSSASSSLFS